MLSSLQIPAKYTEYGYNIVDLSRLDLVGHIPYAPRLCKATINRKGLSRYHEVSSANDYLKEYTPEKDTAFSGSSWLPTASAAQVQWQELKANKPTPG